MRDNPRADLESERKDPGYRPVKERLMDCGAVELQLTREKIQRQAMRCMDCGTPFCHACGCPLSNVIPEVNDWICRGKWREALKILLSTNNFPEFTGRICPAPCETVCVAGMHEAPVSIRQIELALIEKGFESKYVVPDPPAMRFGKQVAVIGSGPAGLAAADTLNKTGYEVTVYDDAMHPGGILTYGIPDFKLEKWVVDRRKRLMEAEGVTFEMGVTVGEDISYNYLKTRFHAICLACGAREPRDLKVPGRDLKGIHFAMEYLTQQNKRIGGEALQPSEGIVAAGKAVVVIGGGNTGSDCVGTALRQGARTVYQCEILPQPAHESSLSTPWPVPPAIIRHSHADEDGSHRLWSVMAKRFVGGRGNVKRIQCVEVEWEGGGHGSFGTPEEKAGTDFILDADLVLLAMGYVGPGKNNLLDNLALKRDARGNIEVDDQHMTHVKGVFAAGDMAQGQSLVVKAIADGRKTACGIMRYLRASGDDERAQKD